MHIIYSTWNPTVDPIINGIWVRCQQLARLATNLSCYYDNFCQHICDYSALERKSTPCDCSYGVFLRCMRLTYICDLFWPYALRCWALFRRIWFMRRFRLMRWCWWGVMEKCHVRYIVLYVSVRTFLGISNINEKVWRILRRNCCRSEIIEKG